MTTMLNLTLLLSIGDWIDGNPATSVILVIQAVLLIIWLSKLEWGHRQTRSDVSDMSLRIDQTENGLHSHQNDRDAHVNQLYIGSLAGRIEKLEHTVEQSVKDLRGEMTSGHDAISAKIDRQFEHLNSRIK